MAAASGKTRCLYDILCVERSADEGEIKKAYRKQAIKWHPDKNRENREEAERTFKEIQNAYEVLSDPHERSWYDNHRDAILRSGERHQAGGSGGGGGEGEAPEDYVDLYAYFSSSCYKGYDNSKQGFYSVYTGVFDELSESECSRCESKGKDYDAPPSFGNSLSDWADVKLFYDYWSNFCTERDFGWKEPYNLASAPNRKVRRLMEEENKKVKKQAKREFNDLVRDLVAFVKKRDKRVTERQKEEAERKAQKKKELDERRRLEKEERIRKAQQFDDSAFVDQEDIVYEEEGFEEEEEKKKKKEEVQGFYCVVCSKRFKSEKQFRNHEKSKKHLQKVEEMRRFLEEEERAAAQAKEEEVSSQEEEDDDDDADVSGEVQDVNALNRDASSSESSEEESEEDEDAILARMAQKKNVVVEPSSSESEEEEEDEDAILARMTQKMNVAESSSSEGEDEETELLKVEESKARKATSNTTARVEAASEPKDGGNNVKSPKGKKNKTQLRKERKMAQKKMEEEKKEASLKCSTCGETFASRNKLFAHIKKTKHAALKYR